MNSIRTRVFLFLTLFLGTLCAAADPAEETGNPLDIGDSPLGSDLTVDIPSDFATLQTAIDELATVRVGQSVRIILRIESGHRPASGVVVKDGNYSHFYIEAADRPVIVASDFSGDFVRGENAVMPTLACLVDMDDKGGDGYSARRNSRGQVLRGCGVINAGSRGLYANETSFVGANRSNFSGANNRTLWVTRGSTVHAQGADLSNGIKGESGPASAVSARRASVIDAQGADISNANANAVSCDRASRMNLQDATITGAAGVAILAVRGSIVAAGRADLSGASGNAIRVFASGTVSAEHAVIDGAGSMGVFASDGGNVSANNAEITNSGSDGVRSTGGAVVAVVGATVTGSGGHDLRVEQGGTISAPDTVTSDGAPSLANTNVSEFSQPGPYGIIYGP